MTEYVQTMMNEVVENKVMFAQVCDLLSRLDTNSENYRFAIFSFMSEKVDIDIVRDCLDCALSNNAFIPMHVMTVAAEVAMETGLEKRRGIRNALLPVYWLHGIKDPM